MQRLISQESSNQAETADPASTHQSESYRSAERSDRDAASDLQEDLAAADLPEPELPPEPEPNAWEVWTYLERERQKTLTRVGTFTNEWEASRFVDAAERKNSGRLRIHYEIHPIIIPSETSDSDATVENSSQSEDLKSDRQANEPEAIDVEVLVEERNA